MDLFSFAAGFFLATVLSVVILAIILEIRKKRAVAFSRRFAVISEGLSSLKALAFSTCGHLKKMKSQLAKERHGNQKLQESLDGLVYIFDNLSAGMMPPTEEIAMEALQGRNSSSKQRAYEDGLKFRDDVRKLRQMLKQQGLDGVGRVALQTKKSEIEPVRIVDNPE